MCHCQFCRAEGVSANVEIIVFIGSLSAANKTFGASPEYCDMCARLFTKNKLGRVIGGEFSRKVPSLFLADESEAYP